MRRTLAFNLMWRAIRLYANALVCLVLVGFCLVAVWRSLSSSPAAPSQNGLDFSAEIQRLEQQVASNKAELVQLRKRIFNAGRADTLPTQEPMVTQQCPVINAPVATSDYNIFDIIDKVEFTNENGGAWTQGWPIKFDNTQWDSENKLKVFVVPHSHNDPGWLKTFEKYYLDQTKKILSNAVTKLNEFKDMKFIWAEISFFSKWFDDQTEDVRAQVRQLIESGRLEIVTGGWVMNDEANTHYYAMIEQLVLGHEWLKKNIPKAPKPQNGWAIDPFGLSPTMAYMLKNIGMKHMVIQRVHYFLKKYLARQKALEFHWRQPWDSQGESDMFCHTMPFYSYDAPHSCGPDPSVCCQFDFHRLRPSRISCPWNKPPQRITDENIQERSQTLLEQYRMKAQLYQTNSIMVPLGDDFRYDQVSEWDNQYNNYKKLMDYINGNPRFNAQVQFGTLKDYFDSVEKELKNSAVAIPSLVGDFFTYADKNDEYWSGYYTSRPYYKFLDRRTESTLRTAEILYSLADVKNLNCDKSNELHEARKGLSLFQHHDGITGTAKTHVMKDYGEKLKAAIDSSMKIIKLSADFLVGGGDYQCHQEETDFTINLNGTTEGYFDRIVLDFNQPTYTLAVVNSLTSYRREIVTIFTTNPSATVLGVPSQISPVFDGCSIKSKMYQLHFIVEHRALEVKSYHVTTSTGENAPSKPTVVYHLAQCHPSNEVFQVSTSFDSTFSISTSSLTAEFSASTGMLRRLSQNTASINLETSFWKFSTPSKSNSDRSGAYLFMPDKPKPTKVDLRPRTILAVRGALVSQIIVLSDLVQMTYVFKESPGVDGQAIEIHNIVDVTRQVNFELLMKVSSSSIESNSYHSDLNGFNFVRRKFQPNLPVQANVYPMTSMAYMQDGVSKLSLVTAQSLGVTDLGEKGTLYVFLDRRLNQDDNRGLAQPVTDNIPALSSFRISLEAQKEIDSRPSLLALLSSHALNSPLLPTIVSSTQEPQKLVTAATLQPCGIHLVNIRAGSSGDYLVTLLNEQYSCSEYIPTGICQITRVGVDLSSLLGKLFADSGQHTSLTDLYPGDNFHIEETLNVGLNQIKTVKLTRNFS